MNALNALLAFTPALVAIAFSGAAIWLILAAVIQSKERDPFSGRGTATITWTPVEQDLPDDGINVLIVTGREHIWTGYREGDDWFADMCEETLCDRRRVTHWAHLPELPQ